MSQLPPPLRYADDLETLRKDEDDTVAELNRAFDEILETTAADYGHAVRAVHAKGHGVFEGSFTIEADLPPELAQGMFAQPGEHPAWVRLSTNPGDILDDAIALPRGLALKVGDVKGERLPGAEGRTQDFVMVNAPAFTAPDTPAFAKNLSLLAKTTDRGEGAKKLLSTVLQTINGALAKVGLDSAVLASVGGAPQTDPLGETYFSVTPFRYGDHVAKFRLRPVAPALTKRTDQPLTHEGRNAIRETVRAAMTDIDGEWAFEVQLARDPDKQPIEDASVEWKEEEAPFVRVATLRLPAQDSWNADKRQQIAEAMRFAPWTGLAAHRPLGNINRARRDTYRHSADFRQQRNRCPIHEPR